MEQAKKTNVTVSITKIFLEILQYGLKIASRQTNINTAKALNAWPDGNA